MYVDHILDRTSTKFFGYVLWSSFSCFLGRDHTSRSGADENGSTVLVARGAGLCVIRCVDGPIVVAWMDAAQRDWWPRGDGLRAGGRC